MKEKLDLAEFYHDLAQNAVVDALKHYLQNVLGLMRGRRSNKRRENTAAVIEEVIRMAASAETELENVNLEIMSRLQNGESEYENQ